jgi:GNAT superfamily N-acetyltransferase
VVIVRGARPADVDGLCVLLSQLPLDEPAVIPVAAARRALDAILSQRGRSLLVAEVDGELVGTADLVVVENLTHDCRPFGMVENVVVARPSRRQGIGRALMTRVISEARAAGCYKVQLLSNQARLDAHEFYETLGFAASATGYRCYLT